MLTCPGFSRGVLLEHVGRSSGPLLASKASIWLNRNSELFWDSSERPRLNPTTLKTDVFIHGYYYYLKCCWLMTVMCLCSWIPTWMKSSSPELSPPWASRWWTCGLYVTKWRGKSEVHLHLFFLFHITWHWLGFCHPGVPWGTALWRWRTKPRRRGAFAKSMGNPSQEPVRYAQALLTTVVAFLVCCINV